MQTSDVRSRKWLLTINNPKEKGFTHEAIKAEIEKLKGCIYWCMSDEVGLKEKTYHTHVYMAFHDATRFSTLHKRFEGAHFDVAKGTSQQNTEYVFKNGKWADTEKEDTRVEGTQESWGEMPVERQGKRNDIDDLYDMIKQGMTDYEILESNPSYMLQIDKIEKIRQTVTMDRFKKEERELSVIYIYGETGTGKTRYVYDNHGFENVYRVTDYNHPFDSYRGQEVLCFDEFRSGIPLPLMLQYLDRYPLELPCRYANKWACYTKVYIISNIALREQYRYVQREEWESWQAFLRRINEVHAHIGGKVHKGTPKDFLDGWQECKKSPFDDDEKNPRGTDSGDDGQQELSL